MRDLHSLITLLASETSTILNSERSTVFLYDSKTNDLWSFVAEGEDNQIRFNSSVGIAGLTFQNQKAFTIEDAQSDSRFNKNNDLQTGFLTRNILAVPINNPSSRCIGVFQVINCKDGTFTDVDLEFLEAVASEAAVIIENVQLLESRKRMFESMIKALTTSIEARDPLTAGHSFDVTFYVQKITTIMGIESPMKDAIYYAALLHDYGKIGIPDRILKKPGALTDDEYAIIKTHVEHTRNILSSIEFEDDLADVPTFAAQHHEKLDGSGYPLGLRGDEISLGGRIISVADVFEALTAKRHYRDPFPINKALSIILSGVDTAFDRNVVKALLQYLRDIGKIDVDEFHLE